MARSSGPPCGAYWSSAGARTFDPPWTRWCPWSGGACGQSRAAASVQRRAARPAIRGVSATDRPLFAEFREFLERSTVGVPDAELAMWMVATVSNAVIHRAVVERPTDLASGAIASELVTLLVRYLKRPVR